MKSLKRLFQGFCAFAAITAASPTSSNTGESTPFTAHYDFYIGGLPIAEISFNGSVGALDYAAKSTVRTRGLLELLVSGRVRAGAEGYRHSKGHLAPDRYTTQYTTRSDARKVSMAYTGEVAKVAINPPEEKKPYDTRASKHPQTLDPVTAAVTMMNPKRAQDLCNRTIPVFDGKRRYDIVLLPQNKRPSGESAPTPSWKLPTTRCFGVYERIAGFEGDLQGAERYFPFDVWFEQNDNGLYRIVRLAGKTKIGFAIGTLRQ